jgi:hypothetical protein
MRFWVSENTDFVATQDIFIPNNIFSWLRRDRVDLGLALSSSSCANKLETQLNN